MRTRQEIERDYQAHAVSYGHKTRLYKKMMAEIEAHERMMDSISAEKASDEQKPEAAAMEVVAE